MEFQAADAAATRTAVAFADEVRAEMARQRKTNAGLATALRLTRHTAGKRLNGGEAALTIVELARAATWLGTSITEIARRAEETHDELHDELEAVSA